MTEEELKARLRSVEKELAEIKQKRGEDPSPLQAARVPGYAMPKPPDDVLNSFCMANSREPFVPWEGPEVDGSKSKRILGSIGFWGCLLALAAAIYLIFGTGPDRSVAPTVQSTTASVPASAPTPVPDTPEVQFKAPSDDPESVTALRRFQALPDPPAPVALSKIKGVWWSEEKTEQNKRFVFVEKLFLNTKPYLAVLSLPDGSALEVECDGQHPPSRHWLGDIASGVCDQLPVLTWVRVAVSDVIVSTQADQWSLTYRANDSDFVSDFEVRTVCDPDGHCTTIEEAGDRWAENRRLGKD